MVKDMVLGCLLWAWWSGLGVARLGVGLSGAFVRREKVGGGGEKGKESQTHRERGWRTGHTCADGGESTSSWGPPRGRGRCAWVASVAWRHEGLPTRRNLRQRAVWAAMRGMAASKHPHDTTHSHAHAHPTGQRTVVGTPCTQSRGRQLFSSLLIHSTPPTQHSSAVTSTCPPCSPHPTHDDAAPAVRLLPTRQQQQQQQHHQQHQRQSGCGAPCGCLPSQHPHSLQG